MKPQIPGANPPLSPESLQKTVQMIKSLSGGETIEYKALCKYIDVVQGVLCKYVELEVSQTEFQVELEEILLHGLDRLKLYFSTESELGVKK